MKHTAPTSQNFRRNISGAALIEFALILPILIFILFGILEFGLYFMKEQIVQRTVSTAASAIEVDPSNEMNKDNAVDSGAGLVDYTAIGNYICAKSYSKSVDAKAGLCEAGDWTTTAPTTSDYTAGAPYYVALVAYVQETSFTPLFNRYIPNIKVSSVFKVGASFTNAPGCNADSIVSGSSVYGRIVGFLDDGNGNDLELCCRDHKTIYLGVSQPATGTANPVVSNQRGISNIACDEFGGTGASAKPK